MLQYLKVIFLGLFLVIPSKKSKKKHRQSYKYNLVVHLNVPICTCRSEKTESRNPRDVAAIT